MRGAALAALALLAGCAQRPQTPITSTIVPPTSPVLHVIVQPPKVLTVPVAVIVEKTAPRRPCFIPPTPAFPDADLVTGGLVDRIARLRAGRDKRALYEHALERALRACRQR